MRQIGGPEERGFLAHLHSLTVTMSQKTDRLKPSSERLVRDIRRATRRHYSAEEKIRIVLEGLRGEAFNLEGVMYFSD